MLKENELECLPLIGYKFHDHCVSSEIYYGYYSEVFISFTSSLNLILKGLEMCEI